VGRKSLTYTRMGNFDLAEDAAQQALAIKPG
jgi:hypothetical protein